MTTTAIIIIILNIIIVPALVLAHAWADDRDRARRAREPWRNWCPSDLR